MQEISNLRQELVRLKAFEPEEANIPLEITPCNTLPNTATIYNALQHTPDEGHVPLEIVCPFLRRAAHSGVSAGR